MKKQRQTNGIHAGEAVIRRPVFEPLLFLSLVLLGISVCFLERLAAESLSGLLALEFSVLAEFFIWRLVTLGFFVLWIISTYKYIRFKVVIRRRGLTVAPILGETHDVAFSLIEKVRLKRFSTKGAYIELTYGNRKICIPYTVNGKGAFKQKTTF